ncbi:MAG: hypothetical protein RBT87_02310 [bacterium]|nr:hypothetical protein [bacterium]
MSRINKVETVWLSGGLFGTFFTNPTQALRDIIVENNNSGWHVKQVIGDDRGNIFLWLFRLALLIVTLGIYTTANGYTIIFEKETDNLLNNLAEKIGQSVASRIPQNIQKEKDSFRPAENKREVKSEQPKSLLHASYEVEFDTISNIFWAIPDSLELMDWNSAKKKSMLIDTGDYNWRLPTIEELESAKLMLEKIPGGDGNFWTSDEKDDQNAIVFSVQRDDAFPDSKQSKRNVVFTVY